MVLRAREIMTDRVVSVAPGTPLSVAREWLAEGRFTALPVVDERNRLVGIVSAADLVDPRVGPEATVGAVMSRDVLSAHPDTDVGIIARRLNTYGGVRVMPIVDHGLLVGIVTAAILLRLHPAALSAAPCSAPWVAGTATRGRSRSPGVGYGPPPPCRAHRRRRGTS